MTKVTNSIKKIIDKFVRYVGQKLPDGVQREIWRKKHVWKVGLKNIWKQDYGIET